MGLLEKLNVKKQLRENAPVPAARMTSSETKFAPTKRGSPRKEAPVYVADYSTLPGIFIGWDTETHLIKPNDTMPPLVCLSWDDGQDNGLILRDGDDWKSKGLAYLWFAQWLDRDDATLVGHNQMYDLGIMLRRHPEWLAKVLRKIRLGLIRDTHVIAKLVAIRQGWMRFDPEVGKPQGFSLGDLVLRYFKTKMVGKAEIKYVNGKPVESGDPGPDVWRLRYAELDGVPRRLWPEAAVAYPLNDARWHRKLFIKLVTEFPVSPDEIFQTEKFFWLSLAGAWGITHDPELVAQLEAHVMPIVRAAQERAVKNGLMWAGEEKIDLEKLAERLPEDHPRTPGGKKKLDQASLKRITDPVIQDYLKFKKPTPVLRAAGLCYTEEPSKNMKAIRAAVVAAYAELGESVPMTAGGEDKVDPKTGKVKKGGPPQVSTSRETLKNSMSDVFEPLLTMGEYDKLKTTYLPAFKRSVELGRICPSHNPLCATGRNSVFGEENLNNQPRLPGVRECHRARQKLTGFGFPDPDPLLVDVSEGFVYVSSDYKQIELCALSQVCLELIGWSNMAEAIKNGKDLHILFAAVLLNITYEEAVRRYEMKPIGKTDKGKPILHPLKIEIDEFRQRAKAANFGFPGGLGWRRFKTYAKQYKVLLTDSESEVIRNNWLATFAEIPIYFKLIDRMIKSTGSVTQLRTQRVRGGLTYSEACNTLFQGLTADGAGHAVNRASEEMYLVPSSPLYGSRLVAFIYDELIIESPKKKASDAAKRLDQIMVEAMQWAIPDVPVACDATIMTHWSKKAARVELEDGTIAAWEMPAYEEILADADKSVKAKIAA